MRRGLCIFAVATALVFGASATVPAVAQTQEQGTSMSAAGKKQKAVKRHGTRRHSNGRQIACTIFGCHPVPRNCRPVTGYNFWGEPTGFDDIACR